MLKKLRNLRNFITLRNLFYTVDENRGSGGIYRWTLFLARFAETKEYTHTYTYPITFKLKHKTKNVILK